MININDYKKKGEKINKLTKADIKRYAKINYAWYYQNMSVLDNYTYLLDVCTVGPLIVNGKKQKGSGLRNIAKDIGFHNYHKLNNDQLKILLAPENVLRNLKSGYRQNIKEVREQENKDINKSKKIKEMMKTIKKGENTIKKASQIANEEYKKYVEILHEIEEREMTIDRVYKFENIGKVGVIRAARITIINDIPQSHEEFAIKIRDLLNEIETHDIGGEYMVTYFKVIYQMGDSLKYKAFSVSTEMFREDEDEVIINEFKRQLEKFKNRDKRGSGQVEEDDELLYDKFDIIYEKVSIEGKGDKFKHQILKYDKTIKKVKDRCFYNCLISKKYDVINKQKDLNIIIQGKIKECFKLINKGVKEEKTNNTLGVCADACALDGYEGIGLLKFLILFIEKETRKKLFKECSEIDQRSTEYYKRHMSVLVSINNIFKESKEKYKKIVKTVDTEKRIEEYEKNFNTSFFIISQTSLTTIYMIINRIYNNEILITSSYPEVEYDKHLMDYEKNKKLNRYVKKIDINNLSFSFYYKSSPENYIKKRRWQFNKKMKAWATQKKDEFYSTVKQLSKVSVSKCQPSKEGWVNLVLSEDIKEIFPNVKHYLLYEYSSEHFEIVDKLEPIDDLYYDGIRRFHIITDKNTKKDILPITEHFNQKVNTKAVEETIMDTAYIFFDYETVADFKYYSINREYSLSYFIATKNMLKGINDFYEMFNKIKMNKGSENYESMASRAYIKFFREFRPSNESGKYGVKDEKGAVSKEDEEIEESMHSNYSKYGFKNLISNDKYNEYYKYNNIYKNYEYINDCVRGVICRKLGDFPSIDDMERRINYVIVNCMSYCHTGFNCTEKLLELLVTKDSGMIYKLVSFNGVNFDNYILYKGLINHKLPYEIKVEKELIANGQFLYYTINKRHSVFDVRKFVQGKLIDCCKNFKIPEQFYKVDGFSHWDMQKRYMDNSEEFLKYCFDNKELEKYNIYDCVSLSFIFYKYKEALESIPGSENYKIEDSLTLGSYAMKILDKYQKEKNINNIKFRFDTEQSSKQLYDNMNLCKRKNGSINKGIDKYEKIEELESEFNKVVEKMKNKEEVKILKTNYAEKNYYLILKKYYKEEISACDNYKYDVKISECELNIEELNCDHKKELFNKYYKVKMYNKIKMNKYKEMMTKKLLKFYKDLRNDRVGGRVQLFNGMKRIIGKMHSLDVCSLYPYILLIHKCYFPTGDVVYVNNWETFKEICKKKNDNNILGHFYVSKLDQSKLGNLILYPGKSIDGNDWDFKGEIQNKCLSSVMIKKLLKEGLIIGKDIIINEGFYYSGKCKNYEMFKPLLELMKLKNIQDMLSSDKRNTTLRQTYKDVLNIVSGKKSQCVYTNKRKVLNEQQYEEFMKRGSYNNINCIDIIGGKVHLTYKIDEDTEIMRKGRDIMTGSLIYDYSRIYMYDIYKKIPESERIYTDTDSIKITPKGYEEFLKYASNTIVNHWPELEKVDERYVTHKLYEPNSKVFGSLEDEYNGGNYNLFYHIGKKFYCGLEIDNIEKYININELKDNEKINVETMKSMDKVINPSHVKTSMKGVSPNFVIMSKDELKPYYDTKKKKYDVEKLAIHYNTKLENRLSNNYVSFFEQLLHDKEGYLLTFSMNRIHSNTSHNVTVQQETKFNKKVYSTTSNYLVKQLKF